jgi:uncharacterized repeat protein (TIGR01451 family)
MNFGDRVVGTASNPVSANGWRFGLARSGRGHLVLAVAVAVVAFGVVASDARAGSPPSISFTPSSGTFGPVASNATSAAQTFTLKNTGGSATGTLTLSLSGTGASAFQITFDGCSAVSLGPREPCSVSLTYTGTSGGNTDTATLKATGEKSSAVSTLQLTGTTSTPPADLAITNTDGQTTAVPGLSTTYTIVVSNNGGGVAVAAAVVDHFPAAITFPSWTATASPGSSVAQSSANGDINTTVTLLPGGKVTFTVLAQIDPLATGTLSNTATVSPPSGLTDPTPDDNTATDTDTLT